MFKRLKNFWRELKAAVKKLLFGEDKTVDVTEYEQVEYNDDGTVKSVTKVHKEDSTGSWKDLGRKFIAKIKEGISWCLDHPMQVLGIGGVGGWSIFSVVRGIKETDNLLFGGLRKRREERKSELRIYDDKTHGWYYLCRPLTRAEKNYVLMQQRMGRSMGEVLTALGAIA